MGVALIREIGGYELRIPGRGATEEEICGDPSGPGSTRWRSRLGLIETTDRVTRTANLSGIASSPSPGVGFHKGVRFNLKAIIP